MQRVGVFLFGFREDIDLDQRWWHRLAKVAGTLSLIAVFLWFVSIDADLPQGPGNIRIVESLRDYTIAHPEDGDAVAGFAKKYGTKSGKRESDGSVSYLFFETDMYCAAKPYEHLGSLREYLRPEDNTRPTDEDALAVLTRLDVKREDPDGYTCLLIDNRKDMPGPGDIVGWEHTLRANVIGNAEKYGIMFLIDAGLVFVVLNLYYRGFVFIVCGPRKKA
jgi:hypothetical protein